MKNGIIQTLLENRRNTQKTPGSKTLHKNRNQIKSTNLLILPEKSSSNMNGVF